jgi:hypothetical protein
MRLSKSLFIISLLGLALSGSSVFAAHKALGCSVHLSTAMKKVSQKLLHKMEKADKDEVLHFKLLIDTSLPDYKVIIDLNRLRLTATELPKSVHGQKLFYFAGTVQALKNAIKLKVVTKASCK